MELFDVMRTTFAAREFTDEPVPDEVLFEILDNARFAPSGGNRQGGRVIVVRNSKIRNAIAEYAVPAAKRYVAQQNAGEIPWNSVVPTSVTDEMIEDASVPPVMINLYRQAPVVLVFVVDLKLVAATDQFLSRIGVISGASIYPLVWNTLLAARQAGFGGTLTTLAAACEPKLKQLLGIPEEFAVSAIVPIGKPVKQLTVLTRRPVKDFATRDNFTGDPFTI